MKGGVVIVEGLIGAGKTTLCKALAHALGGVLIEEPNSATNPYLADYYADPKRWAFNIQIFLLSARYRSHMLAQSSVMYNPEQWYIMDRSYFGDECFAKIQRDLGYMDEKDYETYMRLHKDMQSLILYPSAAIFLHTDVATCQSRIAKRASEIAGRRCESGIEDDYLARLQSEIADMWSFMKHHTKVIDVAYSADKTPEEIEQQAREIANQLRETRTIQDPTWTGMGGKGIPIG